MTYTFTAFDPDTGASVFVDKARIEAILGGGAEAGNPSNTTLTTDGAGTLTAAALIGGIVSRSGVTAAAFTDTTVTAVALLAALGGADVVTVGSTAWLVTLRNATHFTETVAGGSGVTVSGNSIIPALSVGTFLLTYSATTPAFTMYGVGVASLTTSLPLASTTLATNGAGVITAGGIAGGITTRTTVAADFIDTTATAALIVAAVPNAAVGQSFIWTYRNTTVADATLTGGVGVNSAGAVGVVPKNSWAEFLVTLTSLTAVTMSLNEIGSNLTQPALVSTTLATNGAGTITAAGIAGGVTTRTTVAANFTDTTAIGSDLAAALPNIAVGQSFIYRYVNNSTATATIAAGASGMTVSGITTVPAHAEAEFLVSCTAANTFTMVGISRTIPNTTSGTFTANGASAVTVTDVNVTANSTIIPTLKTVGGTVGAVPAVKTITAGTGFTIAGTASDTSVYNYLIIN